MVLLMAWREGPCGTHSRKKTGTHLFEFCMSICHVIDPRQLCGQRRPTSMLGSDSPRVVAQLFAKQVGGEDPSSHGVLWPWVPAGTPGMHP